MSEGIKLPVHYDSLNPVNKKIVREEYIRRQGGKCHYCKSPLDGYPSERVLQVELTPSLFPRGFFTHKIHLHHNHETGMTIGAVHNVCNAILFEYYGE